MPKRLRVIYNPRAGTGSVKSSSEELKNAFRDSHIDYELNEVKTPGQAAKLTSQTKTDQFDAIAVCAGDGTVIAVVQAAYKQEIPVLVLPGGTANVIAKDLGLPNTIAKCLAMYANDRFVVRYLGISSAGKEPFLLDLHFGIWAEALPEVSREQKKRWGQFAYVSGTVNKARTAESFDLAMRIDGQEHNYRAYAGIIANEGYQNVLGMRLFPREHARGQIQIAVIRTLSIPRIFMWWATRLLTGRNLQSVITMLRAKEIVITDAPNQVILDDESRKVSLPLKVSVSPYRAMMLAPARHTGSKVQSRILAIKVSWYRVKDHFLRSVIGAPSLASSQISPNLYLGGQYRPSARKLFANWGITGVVSMRTSKPISLEGIKSLHLPTPDHHAPTLAALRKGSIFIQDEINSGGSVYVHCRLGEGRGPSMAAAYLISQGMRPKDAVAHLERFRLFVRPNPIQMRQLARFEEDLSKRPISEKPSV